ncbi:AsnC family transcriptional regulator [Methyloprofundus sedimenti]|uniref:siroheme decarboxylase n=1 Tax=Methyloprofundus sedimenti TaxID=1420851 RepID=A0A1V8M2F7_9GAMM|nr:Lrp/AsnC family transcriptional regulator [Methyloprofundus sedimenti]OQK15750.1 AsnC family transcriptional regulator [Methyloprofundus sedimenti]
MLSPLHKQLLNEYQQDFPLSPTPYLDIANTLGVTEDEVLTAFSVLSEQDFISRIGPIIQPNHIGISTLVAMAIPQQQLAKVAGIISGFPEVNHNYEREHHFNLWFVLIASDQIHLSAVIKQIERQTQFKTMQLPLLEDYFINLGFQLDLESQVESQATPLLFSA